jgi:hypothetical protein
LCLLKQVELVRNIHQRGTELRMAVPANAPWSADTRIEPNICNLPDGKKRVIMKTASALGRVGARQ